MSEQLALPYIAIDKLAVRDTLRARKDISRGGRESYNIPFAAIEVRENFNTRYDYSGITELAESLLSQGLLEPLYVDVCENGKIYVERGHRRYFAIKHLFDVNLGWITQNGVHKFSTVECFINKSSMTEEMRILNLFGTNMHSKELKPLEQAETAFRLKHCLGKEMSNEDIASKLAISRQSVDNLITIASASDDLKQEIKIGNLTPTAALTLIRTAKKSKKDAEKKVEEAGQSSMYTQPEPKDNLADEVQEGKDADLQAEIYREKETAREKKEAERLATEAVEVPVNDEALTEHIGKRLAADAWRIWTDTAIDKDTGEAVEIPTREFAMKQGKLLDEDTIHELIALRVENVYVYKENKVADSVITELPAVETEKGKYDMDRPEIVQVQNAIKLGDRISVRIEKLEVPEGDKKDLTDWIKWQLKDLLELRDWVHSNKKQNKRDR